MKTEHEAKTRAGMLRKTHPEWAQALMDGFYSRPDAPVQPVTHPQDPTQPAKENPNKAGMNEAARLEQLEKQKEKFFDPFHAASKVRDAARTVVCEAAKACAKAANDARTAYAVSAKAARAVAENYADYDYDYYDGIAAKYHYVDAEKAAAKAADEAAGRAASFVNASNYEDACEKAVGDAWKAAHKAYYDARDVIVATCKANSMMDANARLNQSV